jgi:hypothetical protein
MVAIVSDRGLMQEWSFNTDMLIRCGGVILLKGDETLEKHVAVIDQHFGHTSSSHLSILQHLKASIWLNEETVPWRMLIPVALVIKGCCTKRIAVSLV